MALFGVPGHFSALEWTAWQLVTDEHTHTQSDMHPVATRGESWRLWCPQGGLMTRRATGATDGPSLSHMRAYVSNGHDYDSLLFTYSPHRGHLRMPIQQGCAAGPLQEPSFARVA